MEEIYASLFSIAVMLGGFPNDYISPPMVVRPPKQYFIETSCNNVAENCDVVGRYKGGRVIYVLDTLDVTQPHGASFVIHEYIHYLQSYYGQSSATCRDRVNREIMAYGAQRAYLKTHGIDRALVTFDVLRRSCTKEELNIGN
jgi:hypothetical protein